MKRFYKEFGRRLRKYRKQVGLSQQDLAQRVGLSRSSITNIELGNQHIQLHMLILLATAIGIQPETLLPEELPAADEEVVSADLLIGLPEEDRAWVQRVVRAGTISSEEDDESR